MSIERSATCDPSSRLSRRRRKKTTEAIQREVSGEVDRLLRIIFQERNNGRLDLEAVETAIRSAMHHAGASALTQLLQYGLPDEDRRTIPVLAAIRPTTRNYVRRTC
jgi:hypothetical protein